MGLEDRTEPASQRKLQKQREEGKVAKSNDLNLAVTFMAGMLSLRLFGPFMFNGLREIMQTTLSNMSKPVLTLDSTQHLVMTYMLKGGILILPVLLGIASAGVLVNVVQVGMKIATKALKPDLKRMDPIKGMMKFVSKQGLVELVKSLLKVGVVAWVVYGFVQKEYAGTFMLAGLPPTESGGRIVELCYQLLIKAGCAILFIGTADFAYQKYNFSQQSKMTKQEVKDEHKMNEGDPQIKGKIKARQLMLARQRMLTGVAKADVVLVNPTHIAVAIKYDPESMAAPIVIAKGQRLMAEKIKSIASANGVPIVENIPVARFLYKTVEIGHPIPDELYQTVAEILAYVYRISNKAQRRYKAS